jgi:peptide/nickel transport system permease protein
MIGQTPTGALRLPESVFEGAAVRPAQSYWSESWERLRRNRVGMVALGFILLMCVLAASADLLSTYVTHWSYREQDLEQAFGLPSSHHWLGTDELGRDTLTRLLYGARISLSVGFLTIGLALTLGAVVGLVAGYYGGTVDGVLMRLVDMLLSIPSIFFFILMAILLRPNAVTLSLIIASVGWGPLCRLVRGEVLSIRNRDYILATRSIGAGDVRLIVGHLFPNVAPVMIVAASLGVGQVILAEAALSFLGLGIQAPEASWGNMLTNAQTYFVRSPLQVILPGLAIFLTVLAVNIFGNALRDAFDPRLK